MAHIEAVRQYLAPADAEPREGVELRAFAFFAD